MQPSKNFGQNSYNDESLFFCYNIIAHELLSQNIYGFMGLPITDPKIYDLKDNEKICANLEDKI